MNHYRRMAFNAATSGSDAVVRCGLDHRYDLRGWLYLQFAPATVQFKARGAILIALSHDPLAPAFVAFQ